jgi:hypothetical protein
MSMGIQTKKDLQERVQMMISSSGFWLPKADYTLEYTAKQ